MVENFAEKRLSEFMYQGMDATEVENECLDGAFNYANKNDESSSNATNSKSGRLR